MSEYSFSVNFADLNLVVDDEVGKRVIDIARFEPDRFASADGLLEHLMNCFLRYMTSSSFDGFVVVDTPAALRAGNTIRCSFDYDYLSLYFAVSAKKFMGAHRRVVRN